MPKFINSPDFRHDTSEKLGVLVTNLGTPDSPGTSDVRRYLAEFLWDPRVVEVPRPVWWLVLHGVILRTRPRRSAAAYRKVWADTGSPLLHYTLEQAKALKQRLAEQWAGPVHVEAAMRYGNPSIPDALSAMHANNVRKLLVVPLYPQYSATTTASTFDAVFDVLRKTRFMPELRTVNHYHDDNLYIAALAKSVQEFWSTHGRSETLLMSFHGIPRKYLLQGDPYFCQCHKTARLLAGALKLPDTQWRVSFQSRLGREEWLRPYTDHVIDEMAVEGIRSVDVICPGFSADCLETLEEVALQYGDQFQQHGGTLRYIPALNAGDAFIDTLFNLVSRHSAGWPQAGPGPLPDNTTANEQRLERARAKGAQS